MILRLLWEEQVSPLAIETAEKTIVLKLGVPVSIKQIAVQLGCLPPMREGVRQMCVQVGKTRSPGLASQHLVVALVGRQSKGVCQGLLTGQYCARVVREAQGFRRPEAPLILGFLLTLSVGPVCVKSTVKRIPSGNTAIAQISGRRVSRSCRKALHSR